MDHSEPHGNGTSGSLSNGRVSKMNREQSLGSLVDERLERLSIAESEGSSVPMYSVINSFLLVRIFYFKTNSRTLLGFVGSVGAASTDTKVPTQSSGRSFIGNVMDTLLLKNTTFRSVRAKPVEAAAAIDSFQVINSLLFK